MSLGEVKKPAKASQRRKIRARWDLAKHRPVETTTKTEDEIKYFSIPVLGPQ
ncbi:hypothetical protein C1H76_6776 [Elsinoe australis]|uniref:Uncharacterized protein n=1 Tax=Elsinoe australis TaxID=40998 RepID=A0A4U7AVM5_9PEZI|nr:hypothetical protein C1H76_6776 [Elsinoe australis]